MNEKIIAACGNDCAACPRYIMHPYEKTDEERTRKKLQVPFQYKDVKLLESSHRPFFVLSR